MMNLEELLHSLPSKDEIAHAIGLQHRSTASSVTTDLLPALGILGTGMLIGAGLALLFAPKAGRETRHDIAEKMHEYGGQARDIAEQAGEQGRQLASAAANQGRHIGAQAADYARDHLSTHTPGTPDRGISKT